MFPILNTLLPHPIPTPRLHTLHPLTPNLPFPHLILTPRLHLALHLPPHLINPPHPQPFHLPPLALPPLHLRPLDLLPRLQLLEHTPFRAPDRLLVPPRTPTAFVRRGERGVAVEAFDCECAEEDDVACVGGWEGVLVWSEDVYRRARGPCAEIGDLQARSPVFAALGGAHRRAGSRRDEREDVGV